MMPGVMPWVPQMGAVMEQILAQMQGTTTQGNPGPSQSTGGAGWYQPNVTTQYMMAMLAPDTQGNTNAGTTQAQHGHGGGYAGQGQSTGDVVEDGESAYDRWAKRREMELQQDKDKFVEKMVQADRKSAREGRFGRPRWWFPSSAMIQTKEGPALQDRRQAYAQLSYDWAAIHDNGFSDEDLLTSSRESHEATSCRVVAVAMTPTEASALAEGSAVAVTIRSSMKMRDQLEDMLGGVDWSVADTIQLAKMKKIIEVAAGQLGIPTGHWERMLSSGLNQSVPGLSAKDVEAHIQREVEKRLREQQDGDRGRQDRRQHGDARGPSGARTRDQRPLMTIPAEQSSPAPIINTQEVFRILAGDDEGTTEARRWPSKGGEQSDTNLTQSTEVGPTQRDDVSMGSGSGTEEDGAAYDYIKRMKSSMSAATDFSTGTQGLRTRGKNSRLWGAGDRPRENRVGQEDDEADGPEHVVRPGTDGQHDYPRRDGSWVPNAGYHVAADGPARHARKRGPAVCHAGNGQETAPQDRGKEENGGFPYDRGRGRA